MAESIVHCSRQCKFSSSGKGFVHAGSLSAAPLFISVISTCTVEHESSWGQSRRKPTMTYQWIWSKLNAWTSALDWRAQKLTLRGHFMSPRGTYFISCHRVALVIGSGAVCAVNKSSVEVIFSCSRWRSSSSFTSKS